MSPVALLKTRPWGAWRRQVLAVMRLELRKCFLSKRLIAVYVLALLPLLVMALNVGARLAMHRTFDEVRAIRAFATMFQGFVLRFTLFLGCAAIFTNIFRGEVLEKTLHFYFLSAVRREVVVVGKFLSGLTAALVFYLLSVGGTYLLAFVSLGLDKYGQFFQTGPGLDHLGRYLAMTAMACLGYGAVFTLMGLLVRNPVVPALLLMGWEYLNFLLPPVLKSVSVVFYLQSLMPITLDRGPFAVLADPTPPLLSALGLLVFALVILVIAAWRIRRLEISYAAE